MVPLYEPFDAGRDRFSVGTKGDLEVNRDARAAITNAPRTQRHASGRHDYASQLKLSNKQDRLCNGRDLIVPIASK